MKTIKLKGNEYAQVAERLKLFREENPNGSIKTKPKIGDGDVVFKCRIVKDKSDENSAEATGHSFGKIEDDKSFEKLETVAVGRALALLGYLASGEIASAEEMLEYYEYKEEKYNEQIEEAKSVEELMKIWDDMNSNAKKTFTEVLSIRKKELLDEPTDK